MRNRITGVLVIVAATLLFSSIASAQTAAESHALSGVWMTSGYRFYNEELSLALPSALTPWGEAKFHSYKTSRGPRAIIPALGNDPIGKCDPMGVPRILLYDTPTEFVQLSGRMVQFFERSHKWRTIYTDGRALPGNPDLSYHGYAVGKWEGDTFVIESVGFDERSWLDQYGNPHSDQMRLVERWRRVDAQTIELQMTITDPKTYTKPLLSGPKIFKLQRNAEIIESQCVPSEEEDFNRRIRDPAAGIIR